jgi:hypothetical protein
MPSGAADRSREDQRLPPRRTDVPEAYLGDPSVAGEPPGQLVGVQPVTLGPGQSTQVTFATTPRDTSWWDNSEAPGMIVGDSGPSAVPGLMG